MMLLLKIKKVRQWALLKQQKKKLLRQIKKNKKQFKPITTTKKLLAKNFYKVIETNDLRYILDLKDFDNLPEYDQELLLDAWDMITDENAKDTGNNSQKIALRKRTAEINNLARIELMENCRLLLHLDKDQAEIYLKNIGFVCTGNRERDILKLKNKILQAETTIRINRIKDNKKDNSENVSSFYDILAIIHKNITYVDENMLTVKMMNKYLNSIKQAA